MGKSENCTYAAKHAFRSCVTVTWVQRSAAQAHGPIHSRQCRSGKSSSMPLPCPCRAPPAQSVDVQARTVLTQCTSISLPSGRPAGRRLGLLVAVQCGCGRMHAPQHQRALALLLLGRRRWRPRHVGCKLGVTHRLGQQRRRARMQLVATTEKSASVPQFLNWIPTNRYKNLIKDFY